MEARPHIYTQYCRIKGNTKDHSESSAGPLDDSQGFPSVPKSLCDFLWVRMTHRRLFLATRGPQSWARGWVAARTCWECVLNKVLLDLEARLKLSKATVLGHLVTSLGLKLMLNKYVKIVSSCCTISRHISMSRITRCHVLNQLISILGNCCANVTHNFICTSLWVL